MLGIFDCCRSSDHFDQDSVLDTARRPPPGAEVFPLSHLSTEPNVQPPTPNAQSSSASARSPGLDFDPRVVLAGYPPAGSRSAFRMVYEGAKSRHGNSFGGKAKTMFTTVAAAPVAAVRGHQSNTGQLTVSSFSSSSSHASLPAHIAAGSNSTTERIVRATEDARDTLNTINALPRSSEVAAAKESLKKTLDRQLERIELDGGKVPKDLRDALDALD